MVNFTEEHIKQRSGWGTKSALLGSKTSASRGYWAQPPVGTVTENPFWCSCHPQRCRFRGSKTSYHPTVTFIWPRKDFR